MQDLQGKSAFITGGANGIGFAMAASLAREGVAVAIADIDESAAKSAAKRIEEAGGRAVPVVCDVTSEESLGEAADRAGEALGNIQILANNAGAFTVSRFEETHRRDWEWLMEINVIGVVSGLQTFLPRMRAHGESCHIINTASVSGHIPVPGLSIYTASKFAVVGLSECLRLELEDSEIGISVLCPGIVKTGLMESSNQHRSKKHGGGAAHVETPMSAVIETGSDPAEIGDQVVRAVKAGDFYILTHPNVRPVFEERFDAIMKAYSA